MKKHLLLRMIVLFAAILLVFAGGGVTKAEQPHHSVTYYVNDDAEGANNGASWQDAFTDLQSALDAAVSGDEIWVAGGTYTPDASDRDVSFRLKSGVAIYGGFAGDEKRLKERRLDPSLPSVLSGDIGISGDDTDNSLHVVYASGVTDAVLDGFTVTGGRGHGSGYEGIFAGAGMYNENSLLTVANCTFSDNRVAVVSGYGYGVRGYGAGMYNLNSAPIVSNCKFIANQAGKRSIYSFGYGGGMYNEGYFDTGFEERWPLVTGCTFSDNVADSSSAGLYFAGGGGMYNYDCSPTVDRCTFTGNLGHHGGGMLNYGGFPTIANCIFNTNSNTIYNGFGGAIFNEAYSKIVNCTFYQNGWRLMDDVFRPYTALGGAIMHYPKRCGSEITNCIFSENAATWLGGAVSSNASINATIVIPTLTNCLFYENIIFKNGWGDVSGYYNDVNNLYDIDPLLVDPESGDFHLWYDSPCIDAGYALTFGFLPSPLPSGLPNTDFEGDQRIVDGDGDGIPAVDIGVDEYVPNLSGLGWFIQGLVDTEKIEQSVANSLLVYVDAAQAALDREDEQTAVNILNELITDAWNLLEDTETAKLIQMKTLAVIEEI